MDAMGTTRSFTFFYARVALLWGSKLWLCMYILFTLGLHNRGHIIRKWVFPIFTSEFPMTATKKRLNLTGKPWQSLRPRLAFDDPVELPRDERWDRGCRDVESCRPGVYNNNVSIVDSFYYISIYFKWKDRMYDKWIFGRSIYAF